MPQLPAFKAYDIRGRVPEELDAGMAWRLGLAYAELFQPRRVALGRDCRDSSELLLQALAAGLNAGGVEVLDLGLCGTEESYWAAQQPDTDGAIQITASHNPLGYNGMKLVRGGAVPVSGDSGLRELERRVTALTAPERLPQPDMRRVQQRDAYVQHLLGYVDLARLKPLKIVVNAGNGVAGLVIDALEPWLPFQFVKLQHEPDGRFPNGIPNPLLPEMRAATTNAVRTHQADFGIAWDGDFDRCFLFDAEGQFIEGYYIVGLLAEAMLRRESGARIIHDPRLCWNTIDIVQRGGGVPVQSKTGHAFIKERMRAENAIYGGEMSAHHYFRDFAYCDNGNIPWLLVAQLLSDSGLPLSALVEERQRLYPASGEVNRRVANVNDTIRRIEDRYTPKASAIDRTDGISLEFDGQWRFNLRGSNTEPLLRLNVEARGDQTLMQAQTEELLAAIDSERSSS